MPPPSVSRPPRPAHPPVRQARRRARSHMIPARPVRAWPLPRRISTRRLPLLLAAGVGLLGVLAMLFVGGVLILLYTSGELSSAAGPSDPPAVILARDGLILRDGGESWRVPPENLGDAGIALVPGEPGFAVDPTKLTAYLQTVKPMIDTPPVNAGVRLKNGEPVAVPAIEGREVNVPATVARMTGDPVGELSDGALDLVMMIVNPAITDARPLVELARGLLASPFTVNAYDPIRDEWLSFSAPPEVWSAWLVAAPSQQSPSGLALAFDTAGPETFLSTNARFADERFIKLDEAIDAMQDALNRAQTSVTIRIWHGPTQYTVQAGETLASIGEKLGMPYPYIQAENPGINFNALSVGQVLTIPSKDVLVPLEPVPNKRIIISRSQQRMWAYENGQVVFDWVVSTGIASSPTALGVFQVQSHELNAYADQWDLYMPHFVGFYHPGPNMDLMNGFHGFPTRTGGYLLWTDDLGRPATYGCVLLSLENAETLYNWAEEGVVVVVQA